MKDRSALYQTSLEEKKRILYDGLGLLGCRDLRPEVLSTPPVEGFRTRVKLKLYRGGRSPRICGTDPLRGEVTLREMSWIVPSWARDQLLALSETLLARAEEAPVDGCEIKLAHGRRQFHASLSVSRNVTLDFAPVAAMLMSRCRDLTGVAVPSQRMSFGDPWIRHEIGGRGFIAHHAAFFQSHPELTPMLLDITKDMLEIGQHHGVLDLYCGVGLLSLYGMSVDAGIVGVDSDPRAVESARRNAARWGFSDTRYIQKPVEAYVETAAIDPEVMVVLDPPRAGIAERVIRLIAGYKPRTVCMVSCCTRTLIRDLEVWTSCGYALRELAALDMFPYTEFLETVSRLEKTA